MGYPYCVVALCSGDRNSETRYPMRATVYWQWTIQSQGDIFFNDLAQGIVRHASLDAAGNVTDVNTFANDAAFVVQMVEEPDELLYYVNLVQGTVGRWVLT